MAYNQSRQDSSGTLKTTISLGRTPAIVHSGPFYLMKEPPESSELTGATNLINHHRLSNSFLKLSGKKKNELSSFLHNLTDVDVPPERADALSGSTLMSLLEGRINTKEILPLTTTQLIGFRLHPGQLPPQYRLYSQVSHKKHKKHKKAKRNQPHDSHAFNEAGSTELGDQALERKKKDKKKEKRKKKHKKDQSPSSSKVR